MKALNLISFFLQISLVLTSQTIDIKNPTEQYDCVIITHSYFTNEFDDFIEHKENVKSLKAVVVTVEQIYTDFPNFNSKPKSIRQFISHAGKNWPEPQPNYFFLAGDVDAVPNFEVVGNLEYDTVYTDFFYGVDFENNVEDEIDYFIGRISARNTEELQNYLLKVIEYESTPLDEWHNNILIAGYDGTATEYVYQNLATGFTDNLYGYLRSDVFLSPLEYDLSSFRNNIINGINIKGYSSIFLIGNSNYLQFGDPDVFNIDNIDDINTEYSPLIVFMGKQIFSNNNVVSLIDKTLFNRRGTIGGISPIGLHYIHLNSRFNRIICDYIYSENGITIAEAMRKAFNDEEFSFNFPRKDLLGIFGDPSLSLKYDILASADNEELVKEFALNQNYPNPFNPSTVISFSLPKNSNVQLKVFDLLGREIATLINGNVQRGNHSIEFDASGLSSGIYFYRITADEFTSTKKMLLIR